METPEKLTEQMRFRASEKFAARLAKLAQRSGWDSSEILRDGLEVSWPCIEAHVLAQSGKGPHVEPALLRKVAEAQRLGIDVEQVLKAALINAA